VAKELTEAEIRELTWWTVRELANRLRVDASTVRRWCESETIKAGKYGGQWRIHRTVVAELEAKGKPELPPTEPADPAWKAARDYYGEDSEKIRA
jgi:excisionase family DNA binding protein